MNKVFIYGSLNMDLVIGAPRIPEAGETLFGNKFFTNTGGKGANQAVGCAKQGTQTYMMGSVGDDHYGKVLKKSLSDYGVNVDYVSEIEDTNSGIAVILNVDNDNRIILDGGANLVDSGDRAVSVINKMSSEGDYLMCQYENDLDAVFKVIKCAKEKNMFTVVNTAPAIKYNDEIYSYIDYLVVNQTESQILSGIYPDNKEDCLEVFKFFEKLGVAHTVVTMGEKGSYSKDKDVIFVEAMNLDPVDTTGAGDSYIGALVSMLSEGNNLFDSMIYATEVAAITVMKKGAQSSFPTKEEVEKNRLIYRGEI